MTCIHFATNDPGSETFFGWGQAASGIEIPDPTAAFAEIRDVLHGDVRLHSYLSKTTGGFRRAFVYTPAAYERQQNKRYPVLTCSMARAKASVPGPSKGGRT